MNGRVWRSPAIRCLCLLWLIVPSASVAAADLHIGSATVSITPDQPVGLDGQMRTRISKSVAAPCLASVLALESRDGDKSLEQAIFVSCDLVSIQPNVSTLVRERLQAKLPEFPSHKLILSATHTHTAPVTQEGKYEGLTADGVMRPSAYVQFLADQIVQGAIAAWKARQPGKMGYGLGHAVVATNRRSWYANGTSAMYGKTNNPNFRGLEGHEDDGVEVLFFWDQKDQLIATAVNVACPSQEVEGLSVIDADFWHEVRESLHAKHGKDLAVIAWTGAAGDQSPHLMYRHAAEERMRKLRGLTRKQEIARRITEAWEEAYAGAKQDMQTNVPFHHTARTLELPRRLVTEKDLEAVKKEIATLEADPKNQRRTLWNKAVLERYELQKSGKEKPYEMELHVIRLGDVAIATNGFELFTDYGVQIKSRSPAVQTFVIQLAGPGSYLPTERAVQGGGYSAIIQSNRVGPAGGQELVEQTLSAIQALWPKK